ncbi:MAG: cytochrome c maturation protein CcmE [Silvanigrellales bacterium]|jgi:cytochrome c-type biogenesis protein CcmE|nr:cytochrome c maturation protein CcmE [Silvanigrellales bacterium]
MKVNGGQIVGAGLVLGSLALIGWQATKQESSVTFFTPAEVYASPEKFDDKLFRVSGLVLGGTKNWNASEKHLSFRMTDLKGHEFNVSYRGVPPDLFKEGQGVVVEGRLANTNLTQDNTLHATLLMVKHSEVYDSEKDHSQLREAKLLDSILKDEKLGREPPKGY